MPAVSHEFQIFVKPTGPICNLRCRYCYYIDKAGLYPRDEAFRMPEDLLENYIAQHLETALDEPINFSWHGGEPTILGLGFFRDVVELERKHNPEIGGS